MTARETYSSSVATAEATKKSTNDASITTFQETINASGCNVGYTLQSRNFSNFNTAVKNANAALIAARDSAEKAKQASLQAARETFAAPVTSAPFNEELRVGCML